MVEEIQMNQLQTISTSKSETVFNVRLNFWCVMCDRGQQLTSIRYEY